MREGEIVLAALSQADREEKYRPTLILRIMPNGDFLVCAINTQLKRIMPNGDFLVCAISTQLNKYIPEFDEIIRPSDDDFTSTGLRRESIVRLSFIAVIPPNRLGRSIGHISNRIHQKLLSSLSNYLNPLIIESNI